MESALREAQSKDSKRRLQGYAALKTALEDNAKDLLEYDLGEVVDCLVQGLRDNNVKVCLLCLEALATTVSSTKESIRYYVSALLPALIEKFGDAKLPVREKANSVVLELMTALSPTPVLEKLRPSFAHKNWRVREQAANCVSTAIGKFHSVQFVGNEYVELLIKLLDDSQPQVRAVATDTLRNIYQYMGPAFVDKLRAKSIRPGHLRAIMEGETGSPGPTTVESPSSPELLRATSRREEWRGMEETRPRPKQRGNTQRQGTTEVSPTPSPEPTSPDILPVFVATEKELQKEIEEIKKQLPVSVDWVKRIEAMKRLQRIARGNSPRFESFLPTLRRMQDLLVEQITDLRSSIVKEGCQCIAVLAESLGESFDSVADLFFPALLKASVVTIQVVSSSALAAVKRVICATPGGYPRIASKLIEGAKSRNQILRRNAVGFLNLICKRWSKPLLERYVDQLVHVIELSIADAVADVRTAGRQWFWTFMERFPTQGAALLGRLDATTQRYLQEERKNLQGVQEETCAQPSLPPPSQSAPRMPRPVAPQPVRAAFGPESHSLRPVVESIGHPAKQPNDVIQPSANRRQEVGPKVEDPDGREAPVALRRSRHGPMRITLSLDTYHKTTNHHPSDSHLHLSGPQRVVRTGLENHAPNEPLQCMSGSNSHAGRGFESCHTTVRANSGAKRVVIHPVIKEADISLQKENIPHLGLEQSTESCSPSSSLANSIPPSLQSLLLQAQSDLWATRLQAFEGINRLLGEPQAEQEIRGFAEKLVGCFDEHLLDPNSKVSYQALLGLSMSASTNLLVRHIEAKLSSLLPKLFTKLVDGKESFRTLANSVLNAMKVTAPPISLITILASKCFEPAQPVKQKVAALEYLLHLLPSLSNPVSFPSSLARHILLKVSPCLESQQLQLRRVSQTVLASLVRTIPDLTTILSQLPPHVGESLLRALSTIGQSSLPATRERRDEGLVQNEGAGKVEGGVKMHVEDTRVEEARAAEVSDEAALANEKKRDGHWESTVHDTLTDGVSLLTREMSSHAKTEDDIQQILRMSLEADHQYWNANFEQNLLVLLATLSESSMVMSALKTIEVMTERQGELFNGFLEPTLSRLVEVIRTGPDLESHAAQRTVERVVAVVDPERSIETSFDEDPTVLQVALSSCTAALKRLSLDSLFSALSSSNSILSLLKRAFNHSSASVRKAAVFSLVELYLLMGDGLMAFLSDLTTPQMKLLTIYINKRITAGLAEQAPAAIVA